MQKWSIIRSPKLIIWKAQRSFKCHNNRTLWYTVYFLYKSIYFLPLTVFSSLLGSKCKETSPGDSLVCRPQPFYDYWWRNIFLAKKLFLLLHLSFVFSSCDFSQSWKYCGHYNVISFCKCLFHHINIKWYPGSGFSFGWMLFFKNLLGEK